MVEAKDGPRWEDGEDCYIMVEQSGLLITMTKQRELEIVGRSEIVGRYASIRIKRDALVQLLRGLDQLGVE